MKRVALLTLVVSFAACQDSPLAPPESMPSETTLEDPAVSLRYVAPRTSWIKLTPIMTGVAAWIDPSDPTRVVVGMGKDRAKEATWTGYPTGSITSTIKYQVRIALFMRIGRYFGAPSLMGLENNREWLKRVRDGKKVGLWVLYRMTPDRYSPTGFQILDVRQRPRGSDNPPW